MSAAAFGGRQSSEAPADRSHRSPRAEATTAYAHDVEVSDSLKAAQAIVPLVDAEGNIVWPQYYALCCDCHMDQYIRKYGIEHLLPCGCQDVPLQAMARKQRDDLAKRVKDSESEYDAWRAEITAQRVAAGLGTITEV